MDIMNSLPLIPHHLFVAAIGNDGRPGQKSSRPEPRTVWPAGRTAAGTLPTMDAGEPTPVSMNRRSPEPVNLASL
ncbi:MAG TPA: hypothetical protein DIC50_07000 [Verrucomicrobia subdivision 3 bacterium]|jgi:hypothetical protein|nr:MAG: hypothetical protein BWX68_01846 [Verrucomicrobia bacterium ADurb.Bin063]HCL92514.1 hypothetical protein [Limisphaerales bacterium]